MEHKKVRAPIKLTCHWRQQFYITTWNGKILKNKFEDRDSNFLVLFSSSIALRAIEKGEEMTQTCWPQFMMTHEMYATSST